MLKIYNVGGHASVSNWIKGTTCYEIKKADLVVFPGGADVNPILYGKPKHPLTRWDDELDRKDKQEFKEAMEAGKKMVGICRGAQFLCVMAGGELVQHQQNVANHHDILTYDGEQIWVSSDHHQAMYPWKMENDQYSVLGWSIGQSLFHEDHGQKEIVKGIAPLDMEVEVAYFNQIDALGIQAHPEWMFPSMHQNIAYLRAIEYFRGLVDKLMDGHKFPEARASYDYAIAEG